MGLRIYSYDAPIEYAGCVIDTFEHNGYHDSDFYAVCWDREKKEIVNVEYDTTRFASAGTCTIDATDDVIRKVYRYYYDMGRTYFDGKKGANAKQAKTIKQGDTVIVIRGRKIAKGTTGVVFWKGSTYNPFSRCEENRIGIEVDGERMFIPEEYAEVVGWEQRLIHGKARKDYIRTFAISSMPHHYRNIFVNF